MPDSTTAPRAPPSSTRFKPPNRSTIAVSFFAVRPRCIRQFTTLLYSKGREETVMMRFLTARLLLRLFAGAMLAFATGAAKAADPPPQQAQHKTTQSESYVIIDPLYSSILDGAKPRGLLMIELGLDVPEANFRERVSAALPVLRDAYVRSMTIYALSL